MAFTSASRDAIADGTAIATLCVYVSLHTADPGTSGTSEVAGGSYVRVAPSWAAASSGSKTFTVAATLQIPAGTTITHFGYWSAVSGGTFRGGGALDSSQSYPTGGTYDFTGTVTTS